ncbi:S-phase kinase-associated protein 1-like [Phymastichus coffea]|uniref:S-phase kinase-associated protein 1-like n=1 Tax=Phymastichus coffea TaxID=108790 RepID=UPI00273CF414|nr:S-phase kinase-associated protein 1-like [Phymastichus coffea]
MSMINLESSDKQIFKVERKAAEQSITIKTMLDSMCSTEEDENEVIPLPNINGPILKKITEWMTYHKNDPSLNEVGNLEKRTDITNQWDKKYLSVNKETLFELLLAANYLEIKGLIDISSKAIANVIKGKTSDEIRRAFKFNQMARKEENSDESESEQETQNINNEELKKLVEKIEEV